MFVILFLFFGILCTTLLCAFFLSKYIKISDLTARKIEVFGYILLFVVLVWEFVVKNIVMADFYDSYQYYTNEKLFTIFDTLRNIYINGSMDISQASEYFLSLKCSDQLSQQILTTDIIEAVLQIGSAVCIAIGRFQDIKNASIKKVSDPKETQP